jgi:uncharacterized protein (TIRG00374 family)
VKLPSARSLVRLAIAAGLIYWTLRKSHPSDILAATAHAHLAPLFIAIGLVLFDRTLMAWRWLLLLRPFPAAQRPAFLDLLRVFFVSTFVGSFLPASVGSDAVRAAWLARLHVPLADAVASVFIDRVLGVLSILVMGAVGLALVQDLPSRGLIITGLIATAGACAAVAVMTFSTRGAQLMVALLEKLPSEKLHRAGRALIEAVRRYAAYHGLLAGVLLSSIAVQVLRIIQAYYLGLALGIPAPLVVYFAFVPVILLVMLLPITINGLGTSQAAFVALFTHAGVEPAAAFALSVLFVALGIVGNLPGGLLYTRQGLGPSAPAAPLSDPSRVR